MADYTLLDQALSSAMHKAAEECGMLLGHELKSSKINHAEVDREVYFSGVEEVIVLAPILLTGDQDGCIYLVQSSRDAIVFGSTLLGIAPPRIKEKRNLAIYSEDDVDAYAEVANQFGGSFNTVIGAKLGQKLHLKSSPNLVFNPDQDRLTDTSPIAAGDYFMVRYKLEFTGFDIERCDILVPLQLAALLDPEGAVEPVKEPAPAASGTSASMAPAAAPPAEPGQEPAPLATVLVVDGSTELSSRLARLLSDSGRKVQQVRSEELQANPAMGVGAMIICLDSADEAAQKVCRRVMLSCPGALVFLLSPTWTREQVLRALVNGACDILQATFPDQLLLDKLHRHLG